jgi:ABC-type multidrug transport system ATPase subunit
VAIDGAVIPIPDGGATLGPYCLDLRRAEIASIVGPSGSGKTTLVRAIVERRRPLSGTIVVNAGPKEVAFVPQNAPDRLNRMASALRHMRDVSARIGWKAAGDLLERFRIPADALRRPVGTFSAGQQQRLVLLTALLRRPRLVILDEPTSALDVEMRQELALLLRKLADEEKIAVLVTTHHLPFVSVVSDRIWQLTRLDGEAGE